MRSRHLILPLLAVCLALPLSSATGQDPQTPPPSPTAETTPAPETTPTPTPAPEATPAPAAPAPVPDQAPPSPNTPATTPAPVSDKIEFQLRFPADQGGGSASGSAGNLEYKRDT